MINKIVETLEAALRGVGDGATVLVSGFGDAGMPQQLINGLLLTPVRDLTIVTNNAGVDQSGIAPLLTAGKVRKLVCSYPRSSVRSPFDELYERGAIELELVPQGTLSERIRAAGAGIGGFYVRTSAGTKLSENKETREIGGLSYVLEHPLACDVALVKADLADRWGNLTYRLAARNFGPVMACAAKLTIAQVRKVVPLGDIGPEEVITPGIFVDRVWSAA